MLKKLISFLLIAALLIALLLVLTSCGNGGAVETTTDAITTVDPIAAYHEKRICFKLIVCTVSDTFEDKPEKIVNAGPTDKESLFKLTEKIINTVRMYDRPGIHICIEWSGIGTGAGEVISKIESEFPVEVYLGPINLNHFGLRFDKYDLSQSEFCEKVSELLYEIVSSESVARVYLSDMCPKLPVTH